MGKVPLSVRVFGWITACYMVAFLIAVTWPGFQIFNHVTPIILGLPFNLFCIALFILGGMAVLVLLYRSEQGYDEKQ